MSEPMFSVVVPVYNRRDEVDELLASLLAQPADGPAVEVIVVEDGSTDPCGDIVASYRRQGLDAVYVARPNEGRSPARNAGIECARGRWLVFFDSDCVVPPGYLKKVGEAIENGCFDCYGGPDAAHDSFTPVQKAINVAMTSFLTTGGIRGGRRSMEKFTPRTFNMGFTRNVARKVGGFREMFSEDIDMSKRIEGAGYKTILLADAPVWHKRRLGWRKFLRQVWVFGQSRVTLRHLYPGSMKAVHLLPSLAVVLGLACVVLAILWSPWWLLPIGLWLVAVWVNALITTKSLKVSLLAVPASIIQIAGYGCGLIKAWWLTDILGRGRDLDHEVKMRRGK